ncbi:HD domain-containing protein [Candidatus Uhrbacteria bacterium]|nr:HD domain-containing protein [Candidatus Uhrbacteria bacterium]
MPSIGEFKKIEPFSRLPVREKIEAQRFPSPETFIEMFRKNGLETHERAFRTALDVCEAVKKEGGHALFVGGCVRDVFLKKISKDFDIEVYDIPAKRLEEIVKSCGEVSEVGNAFGILKIHIGNGIDVDVSLPRTDSKASAGHKGFDVKTDPSMSIKDAAKRRDFTMNALAADPLTGEVFDFYGGIEDLQNRRLRATDKKLFQDDPLRAMRALQFIARFGLSVDHDTAWLIRKTALHLKELPAGRFLEEWRKLLVRGEKPSLGLAVGMALGIFHVIHPEFPPMAETPQEPEWHPEGDVWVHTLMAVDEAAKIAKREGLDEEQAFIVITATLCHDTGKPSTTEFSDGCIRSHAHEQAGDEPTRKFLLRLGIEGPLQDKVTKLVTNHLAPSLLYTEEIAKGKPVSDGAIRRLAMRIYPATIQELVLVAEADHMGRGPFIEPERPEQLLIPDSYPPREWLLTRARDLGVEKSKPVDIIRGKDLIALGYKPGELFGKIIQSANELRDIGYTREHIFTEMYGLSLKKAVEKLESLVAQKTGTA